MILFGLVLVRGPQVHRRNNDTTFLGWCRLYFTLVPMWFCSGWWKQRQRRCRQWWKRWKQWWKRWQQRRRNWEVCGGNVSGSCCDLKRLWLHSSCSCSDSNGGRRRRRQQLQRRWWVVGSGGNDNKGGDNDGDGRGHRQSKDGSSVFLV